MPIRAKASACSFSTSSSTLSRVSAGYVSANYVSPAMGASISSRPLESAQAVFPSRPCCFFTELSPCHWTWDNGSVDGISRGLKDVVPTGPSGPPPYTPSILYVRTLRSSVLPPGTVSRGPSVGWSARTHQMVWTGQTSILVAGSLPGLVLQQTGAGPVRAPHLPHRPNIDPG